MGDLIQDRSSEPSMEQIGGYVSGEAGKRWSDITAAVEAEFGAKPQIAYSVCAGKPGWNVKYKKSGKALCTLYPEKSRYIALVVLSIKDMELFEVVRSGYTPYLNALYEKCTLFNGTKWLMISVTDDAIQEDVKKLMHLKTAAAKKNGKEG